MCSCPVTRTTGISGSILRISGSQSVPLKPGRRTSQTTIAGRPKAISARARSALANDSTLKPFSESACSVLARTSSSSSISRTRIERPSLTLRLLLWGGAWQIDGEACAASVAVAGAKRAACRTHQLGRNHEPEAEPGAGRLAGDEGLEQARQD